MELMRVFLIYLINFYLSKLNADKLHKFERVHIFDNTIMCPGTYVIQEIEHFFRMECLSLCSEHSNCTGVFFQPVDSHCVLCSASVLSSNLWNTTGYTFYKRSGKIYLK